MAAPRLTRAALEQTLDALRVHKTMAAAARAMNLPRPTYESRLRRARAELGPEPGAGDSDKPAAPGIDDRGDLETRTISSLSDRIRTVAEALAKAEVDLAVWEVERHVVNSWEMGAKLPDGTIAVTPLWQVKVWLRRRKPYDPESVKAAVLEAMAEHAPRYGPAPRARPRRGDPHLLVPSVPDLHLGKLAWRPEAGESYDSKVAIGVFDDAVTNLVGRARVGHYVDRIILPVGNDLLHIDTPENTTTAGTRQDVDTRWQRSFQLALRMLVRAIERMAEAAPVTVLIVPGNHDRTRCFYLGEALTAWFRHSRAVTVDNRPTLRKYVVYSSSVLGFTHGSDEPHTALESIMAREQPSAFAQCRCREWHLGHYHTRRQTRFIAGDTHGGTVVRILPSLSGTDAWHYQKGYVRGPKAAEAYLYHRKHGYAGHFAWTPPDGVYR